MLQAEEEHTCYNPNCRRPLNSYPFVGRVVGQEQAWCSASCFTLWRREQRHQASTAFASRVASFFEATDDGSRLGGDDRRDALQLPRS
jgi:hypothetical protein